MAEEQHTNLQAQQADTQHTARIGESYSNTADDEISLKELILKIKEWISYLWSKKWTIIIAGIIGGALGLAYSTHKKALFVAETTFVLEEGENGGGLSQYAGLASMVGIDLGSAGGGAFKGDNIIELYKSRRMIQETLLSKDTTDGKSELLIDKYISLYKEKSNRESQHVDFNMPVQSYTVKHDSVLALSVNEIRNKLLEVARVDKKLSIIKVKVKSIDESFSKLFAEKIVKNVNDFYISTKTKKSSDNVKILEKQADSVRRVLNTSILGVASSIEEYPNANVALQSLRVPSQRKQIDVQANSAIYQEIVKNLEIAKLTRMKETPLVQIIDHPIFPLPIESLSKINYTIAGSVLFAFMCSIGMIVKRILKSFLGN